MTALEAATWLLQLLLPLALIARVAFARARTVASWGIDVALAASCLGAVTLAGLWLALPRWLVPVLAGLLVVAAGAGLRSGEGRPVRGTGHFGRGRPMFLARIVLTVLFLAISVVALAGRRLPEGQPVDLAFPLRQGTYLVAAGGSTSLVNPHRKTRTGERYRPYRGQSHAVDLVKVGSWGSRSAGASPDHAAGFAIFGDSIHAPCSGQVVRAADGEPDLGRKGAPESLEGNHVILDCGGVWVVLAHMVQGSVRVSEGEEVGAGAVLGLVGNSGSSDEPHLHIHAQTPGTLEAPLGGDPLPMTFEGRYLVRNQRIRGG